MFINKYLLILLGAIIAIFLILIFPFYISMIWSILFWLWYHSKRTYKKEETL